MRLAPDQRQVLRQVVEDVVPAPLGLEQQREGRVAANVDAVDRVHLAGDLQGHGAGGLRVDFAAMQTVSAPFRQRVSAG